MPLRSQKAPMRTRRARQETARREPRSLSELEEKQKEHARHGEPQHLHRVLPVGWLPRDSHNIVPLVPALLHVVGDPLGDLGFLFGVEVASRRLRLPDLADEGGEAEGLRVDAGDDLAVHVRTTPRTAARAARAWMRGGRLRPRAGPALPPLRRRRAPFVSRTFPETARARGAMARALPSCGFPRGLRTRANTRPATRDDWRGSSPRRYRSLPRGSLARPRSRSPDRSPGRSTPPPRRRARIHIPPSRIRCRRGRGRGSPAGSR